MKKNIKKSIVEDINFEIELIDDLLREINSVRLNESFLDSLKNFFGGFGKFAEGGMGNFLGKSEKSYQENLLVSLDKLGVELEGDLEINENEKELVAWASSQGYVDAGISEIMELTNQINSLPGPIPDPEDELEMEKWEQGGQYADISEKIATAAGIARGVIKSLASDSVGRSEDFKSLENEADAAISEKSMTGFLRAILSLTDNIAASDWFEKIKKAEKINLDKFKIFGVAISGEPVLVKAEAASKGIREEIGRLESLMKSIQQKARKKQKEDPEKQ